MLCIDAGGVLATIGSVPRLCRAKDPRAIRPVGMSADVERATASVSTCSNHSTRHAVGRALPSGTPSSEVVANMRLRPRPCVYTAAASQSRGAPIHQRGLTVWHHQRRVVLAVAMAAISTVIPPMSAAAQDSICPSEATIHIGNWEGNTYDGTVALMQTNGFTCSCSFSGSTASGGFATEGLWI